MHDTNGVPICLEIESAKATWLKDVQIGILSLLLATMYLQGDVTVEVRTTHNPPDHALVVAAKQTAPLSCTRNTALVVLQEAAHLVKDVVYPEILA